MVTLKQTASPANVESPESSSKPAVVRLQYRGQEKAKGQHVVSVMPSRTVPSLTPTSALLNAQARSGSPGQNLATTSQSTVQDRIVSIGSPTIRMAIRTSKGNTSVAGTTQGVPAIVHTPSGSKHITVPLKATTSAAVAASNSPRGSPIMMTHQGAKMTVQTRPGTPPTVVAKPTVRLATSQPSPHLARIHTAPGALDSFKMDNVSGGGMNGAKKSVVPHSVPLLAENFVKMVKRPQSPVPMRVSVPSINVSCFLHSFDVSIDVYFFAGSVTGMICTLG